MIVAVKRNKKQKLIKIISLLVVVGMFAGYYFYMSNEFAQQEKLNQELQTAKKIQLDKKKKAKKNAERALILEIEKAVDLIGQEYITHVKIIENKVVIICEPETNLDALTVRYGTMALIKNTLSEIIIAIDINYILESRINAK
jgi:hypothetical protein